MVNISSTTPAPSWAWNAPSHLPLLMNTPSHLYSTLPFYGTLVMCLLCHIQTGRLLSCKLYRIAILVPFVEPCEIISVWKGSKCWAVCQNGVFWLWFQGLLVPRDKIYALRGVKKHASPTKGSGLHFALWKFKIVIHDQQWHLPAVII